MDLFLPKSWTMCSTTRKRLGGNTAIFERAALNCSFKYLTADALLAGPLQKEILSKRVFVSTF